MTQNNGGTAKRRGPGRPFPKGVSGNPGGRPKGLMRLIREETGDGEELARFVLQVFRGELHGARLADRMQAATWLADRGFGKPALGVELGAFVRLGGPQLDDEERRLLADPEARTLLDQVAARLSELTAPSDHAGSPPPPSWLS